MRLSQQLTPIQERRRKYERQSALVKEILEAWRSSAPRQRAEQTMAEVRERDGLLPTTAMGGT